MLKEIKRSWQGFVPAYYAHPKNLCAYYHCKEKRVDTGRYCDEHARLYIRQAREQGSGKVLYFSGGFGPTNDKSNN